MPLEGEPLAAVPREGEPSATTSGEGGAPTASVGRAVVCRTGAGRTSGRRPDGGPLPEEREREVLCLQLEMGVVVAGVERRKRMRVEC